MDLRESSDLVDLNQKRHFCNLLGSYLTRWINMSNIPITLDGLFDLMLSVVVVKGKDNV